MLQVITNQTKFDAHVQHVCQSWEWGEFRKTTPSIKKVLRLGLGEKVWQIFFSRIPYLSNLPDWTNLPKCVAYLPRGPMPTSGELDEIKKYCLKEKAIFLKIEPNLRHSGEPKATPESLNVHNRDSGPIKINDFQGKQARMTKGKAILPQHTIYVDLTLPEEKLLANMHEKTRYNIRLAQKKGVVVKEETSPEALEEFIKVLVDTEKRQGFYSHYPDYYRNLWKVLRESEMVYLLNAYVEGKIAAGIMLFRFKDFLYYPYGGSNYEFRQFMAPQLLHFEAMKLGKKLGCGTYDLWGSYKNSPDENDPWWGFYRLKSGLGGKEIDFPQTVDVPLSPLYGPLMVADSLRWKILQLKKKFK